MPISLPALAVALLAATTSRATGRPVNPTREARNVAWLEANREVRAIKPPDVAYVLRGGGLKRRVVALTFDDAPRPATTERLMKVLLRLGCPATFFLIGKQVDRFPFVVNELSYNGFGLGNHSYSHVTLTKLPFPDAVTEYEACNDSVVIAASRRMRFCRPPGGDVNLSVERAGAAVGLTTVLWTDDPDDYTKPGENKIVARVLAGLSDGGVILLHDGVDQTIRCLPKLVAQIRARGYEIVPLDALPIVKA